VIAQSVVPLAGFLSRPNSSQRSASVNTTAEAICLEEQAKDVSHRQLVASFDFQLGSRAR